MTGSSDIKDAGMINNIKIKSKEEHRTWVKRQQNFCPESFKKTAKMSTFTKEKLFTPKLWETFQPKVCIEKKKCVRSLSTKTQQVL